MASTVRVGVRIGVDVGSVRVGVAISDPDGVLATPVTVLARDLRRDSDLDQLATLVRDRDAIEVVVGLPVSLSGGEGPAARSARQYAAALASRLEPVPVRLIDERLSTAEAGRGLRAAGRRGPAARRVIDAAAAVVLLQAALETERATGIEPGERQLP